MTTQLIRARRKPRFGLPWLAMLLGIGTIVFAGTGIQAVTARPAAPVEIIVDGEHPWNISQPTVDAVITEPILAWQPLTIRVTSRLLTYDELQGTTDPGAHVILSTTIIDDTKDFGKDARFTGVGIYPELADRQEHSSSRFAIHKAYMGNLGLGHGPKSVAAAAHRAAEVLDDGPVRTPVFWVAGTSFGLLLTVLGLGFSLSRRMRRESRFRRLTAAQSQLARVVLDLEALEVTYQSTEKAKRPAGFNAAWNKIRTSTLDLARTEDAVIDAVYASRDALKPHTATLLAEFEAGVRSLTESADALMGAWSVIGRSITSRRTLDRLAAPLAFATRELLARLHAAPPGAVAPHRIRRLDDTLAALLTAGTKEQNPAAAVRAWAKAEHALERSATIVNRSLRRKREARVRGTATVRDELSTLRASMGLSPQGSRQALHVLDGANAAARALFGPLPQALGYREPAAPRRRRKLPLPRIRHRGVWIGIGGAITLASLIAGGVATDKLTMRPAWTLTGTHPLRSLAIDGNTTAITEAGIRRYLEDKFTEQVDVTLAVRDAEEHLLVRAEPDTDDEATRQKIDPTVLIDALWKIKGEFPALVDPATGELFPDQSIIPVWTFPDGTVTIPVQITGAMGLGGNSRLVDTSWKYGSYYVSTYPELKVANSIEELARGLQGNGFTKQPLNESLLYWLLTLTFALALVTLTQVIAYGGTVSMRLGRFGRNAKTLRRLRGQLDGLALGLDDSRLNIVAVLGAGTAATSAEADQRIFERALAVAWRMADDLAARPLSQRLGTDYLQQIDKLQNLVDKLGIRDAEAQRRTRELLAAEIYTRAN